MRVYLVEDSELLVQHLGRLLNEGGLVLCGTARSEELAWRGIAALQPDAVLLDLALAPGSGLHLLERLRAAGNGVRVLVLSNNVAPELRSRCLALGAQGFYDKSLQLGDCLAHLRSWLPPLPANEAQRLHALWSTELLDQPEQEDFDSLVRLAQSVTDCPMAAISLVDSQRQWFLAHHGLAERQTSRTVAFCAHTILQTDLMEVEDALLDPRFADNPLVRGSQGVRYYAGLPLMLPGGEVLGTLCVIDRQPRRLTAQQRDALRTLARSVLNEIELRRRLHHLEQEVQRREQAEAHALHLATRDPLTGLPNRRTFGDRLEQHVLQAQRSGQGFAALYIDLDRFKPINDAFGHEVGDQTLRIAAQRLTETLRASDTLARLGGDEFAALLGAVQADAAQEIAHKLLRRLQEPFMLAGQPMRLDASIGVAVYTGHGQTGDELLRHADMAMYSAKHQGGGRVLPYSLALDEHAAAQRGQEQALREGIQAGQLVLHYQPQVRAADAHFEAVEALVRWQHPTLGLLAPMHFIPLAEDCGLIDALGEQVLDLALQAMADWRAEGLAPQRIAVNVSPLQLRAGFDERVLERLAKHGLPSRCLELEITESALSVDGGATMALLERLREAGVSIAVDDFGVGYSCLAQLSRLPIDALKIDRSFVRDLECEPAAVAIVRAVVGMAQSLGLRTIAEGVESAAQGAQLLALGCDTLQGYHISRPLAAPAARDWLLAQRG